MTETLTMGQRRAGQASIEKLVQLHRNTRTRSVLARVFGRSPLGSEAHAVYRDAQAQLVVGGLLGRLPPEWSVISSAPSRSGGTSIDHVVAGPAGVFTISSKLHTGDDVWVADSILVVDRSTLGHITDARVQALTVTGLLEATAPLADSVPVSVPVSAALPVPMPVPVRPVVAIVDAKRITIREQPADVLVLDARALPRILTQLPAVFSASELREIIAVLNNPATWNADGVVKPASDDLFVEFAALDTEVRAAHSRRARWKLAAYAVAVIAPIAVFPYLIDFVEFLTTP